ncbi:MAG: rod shape-determining protein MreD [Eubacteriales bacterium]
MKRRIFAWSVTMLVLWLLQTVFCPVTVFGVGPEYVLCGVVMLGVTEDEKFASVYGFIFGLLTDLALTGGFGSKALFFALTGYLVGRLCSEDFSRSIMSAALFTAVPFVAGEFISFLANSRYVSVADALLYIFLPKTLLTVPVTVAAYFIFRGIKKFTIKREGLSGTW